MHWEGYYVYPQDIKKDRLILRSEETHHLTRVKRNAVGDIVWAVDGRGSAYEIEITRLSKTTAEGRILQIRRRLGEPLAEVTLGAALIKDDRFEWLIEKCTEIGVRRIIPMITEKTISRSYPRKWTRWNKIALSALKQCGRTLLPEITEPKEFSEVLKLGADCHYRLIAEADAETNTFSKPQQSEWKTGKALLLTGPEGGFSGDEVRQAVESGFDPVSLGPRRLRAETAGIVLTTKMLSYLNELE